jgi:hypothetical protein
VLIDLEQLFASAYVGELNSRTEIAIRGGMALARRAMCFTALQKFSTILRRQLK